MFLTMQPPVIRMMPLTITYPELVLWPPPRTNSPSSRTPKQIINTPGGVLQNRVLGGFTSGCVIRQSYSDFR